MKPLCICQDDEEILQDMLRYDKCSRLIDFKQINASRDVEELL